MVRVGDRDQSFITLFLKGISLRIISAVKRRKIDHTKYDSMEQTKVLFIHDLSEMYDDFTNISLSQFLLLLLHTCLYLNEVANLSFLSKHRDIVLKKLKV